MDNQILLQWIPAHKQYDSNEKAASLAKQSSDNLNTSWPDQSKTWQREHKNSFILAIE